MSKFNGIYSYILHGLTTACIVVIGMIIIKNYMPPKLVKIDLISITTHYTELMMKETALSNSTDNATIKKISDNVKANLEPVINDYVEKHNVIVIQAQAVISNNTPDITNQIIEQLDRKLKQ